MEGDEEYYFKQIEIGPGGQGKTGYEWTYKVPVFANWLLWKQSLFLIVSLYVILTVAIVIIIHFIQPGSGVFCFLFSTAILICAILFVAISTLYKQVVHGGDDGMYIVDDLGVHSRTGMGLLLVLGDEEEHFYTDLKWDNISRVTIYPGAGAIDFKEKRWGFPITVYCEPGYIPPALIRYIARHVDPGIIVYV